MLDYLSFLCCNTIQEYRRHFESVYCKGPVMTFDGIPVRFRKRDFDHAFFESMESQDDTFSQQRATRMDWIRTALQDPNAERFIGWNKKKKRYDSLRRVTVVKENYVVVIALDKRGRANFITAYVADSPRTLMMIRRSPVWK
jgi:hypothetical protein